MSTGHLLQGYVLSGDRRKVYKGVLVGCAHQKLARGDGGLERSRALALAFAGVALFAHSPAGVSSPLPARLRPIVSGAGAVGVVLHGERAVAVHKDDPLDDLL